MSKEITLQHKKHDKQEYTFESITKASEFLGVTRNHLSLIVGGKRTNKTGYYISVY